MSPQDGYKRLKRSNKKFLLRESRILGMLTIDMAEEDSCRFGFIESDGWVIVNGMEIEEFTKKITIFGRNFRKPSNTTIRFYI